MTYKNTKIFTALSVVILFAVATVTGMNNVYGEESTEFKMADDVEAVFTFTFRDGIEIHKFPVFNMGENFVDNKGVSFEVEGIVTQAPHLHKAVDEAYKHRQSTLAGNGASFEYQYRYFDVEVDFIKDNQSIRSLDYHNCEIQNYAVDTLRDDQESYLSSKTGFAIVDTIEFNCGGLNTSASDTTSDSKSLTDGVSVENDYLDYEFANNVRTFITFEFDSGVERIEFPYFELTSGFEEDADSVSTQFMVESVVGDYPMLYSAIDNSRTVSGISSGSNTDFEALVEFTQNGDILRALDFRDCRVETAEIITQQDKEDGFTGKSGFALVNQIEFECAGLKPINDQYNDLKGEGVIWKTSFVSNKQPMHEFPTVNNVHAIATFTFADGQEIIDFPLFEQDGILVRSNPSFELKGIVGNHPLLYQAVDENYRLQSLSGANLIIDLFQVDVDLMVGNEVVRGFNYAECRITDYVVESERDKEDGYFKGFALENTFEFECQGFHPNNPVYDAMFSNYSTAETVNTNDLRETHSWGPGFYVQ